MTRRLVIIGAGGFGREVLDVIEAINAQSSPKTDHSVFDVLGFLDDGTPNVDLLAAYESEHLGPVSDLAQFSEDVGYVIGIGHPGTRRRIDEFGQSLGRTSPILVHPSATVARNIELGAGSIICSHVSMTNHIRLGRHVHININSTVGHDAVLGDWVTVSPLVAISGNVTLEAEVFLGTGATINPGVRVGPRGVVGSGGVVLRDVPAGTTVTGVPAKPRG